MNRFGVDWSSFVKLIRQLVEPVIQKYFGLLSCVLRSASKSLKSNPLNIAVGYEVQRGNLTALEIASPALMTG